jgi:hypothetical protein
VASVLIPPSKSYVSVPADILREFVRADAGSPTFKALQAGVRGALRTFRTFDTISRTPDSVRLKKLKHLQRTLSKAIDAYRDLEDTTRLFHLPDEWRTDDSGNRVPVFDVEEFIERATKRIHAAIDNLIDSVNSEDYRKHSRPSETHRNELLGRWSSQDLVDRR